LRALFALSQPCNEQILIGMEDFSTSPRAFVPWVANLATLAVVVAAIGWSGEQRPASISVEASKAAPQGSAVVPVSGTAPAPQPGAAPAHWPAKTSALSTDGLHAVGYSPAKLR
jgi:hypothetical protein